VLSNEVLEEIFTWQEPRKLGQSLSFNYQRQLFLVPDTEETRLLAGQRVTVVELSNGTVQARHGSKLLPLTRFGKMMRRSPKAPSCRTSCSLVPCSSSRTSRRRRRGEARKLRTKRTSA
jgi:hypothetical protein